MKLGKHFEGSSEELANLCENYGFEPSVFLNKPKQLEIDWKLILGFSISFALVSLSLWIFPMKETVSKILTTLVFILAFVNAIVIHLKYERWEVTSITLIGCLIVISLCLDILTPKQAIEQLQNGEITEIKK